MQAVLRQFIPPHFFYLGQTKQSRIKHAMNHDSNKKCHNRTAILPLPAWGLIPFWRADNWSLRNLLNRPSVASHSLKAEDGNTRLFGTHKDPFCAAAAEQIWRLLNEYRASLGLRTLAHNDQLAAAARYMGKRMLQKNEFQHVLSDRVDLSDRIANFGYRYSACGENLAKSWGLEISATALASEWHSGWIHSPDHHRNMIYADWRDVGVAVVKSYTGTPVYYGIENFGTPA